jgi:hypothetical protein
MSAKTYRADHEGRRRLVRTSHGVAGYFAHATVDCPGCTDWGDYGTKHGPFGCDECGYTGKRRVAEFVPFPGNEDAYIDAISAEWQRATGGER